MDCEDAACVDACAEDCENGLDDDYDGYLDCEDDECWGTELCTTITLQVTGGNMVSKQGYFGTSFYYYGSSSVYSCGTALTLGRSGEAQVVDPAAGSPLWYGGTAVRTSYGGDSSSTSDELGFRYSYSYYVSYNHTNLQGDPWETTGLLASTADPAAPSTPPRPCGSPPAPG